MWPGRNRAPRVRKRTERSPDKADQPMRNTGDVSGPPGPAFKGRELAVAYAISVLTPANRYPAGVRCGPVETAPHACVNARRGRPTKLISLCATRAT